MPQMSPLSWLTLYVVFIITLIMFCIMNYYIYAPINPKTSLSQKNIKNIYNWKW